MPRKKGDPNHPRRGNGVGKGEGWGGPARNGGSNSAARVAGPGRLPELVAAREDRIARMKDKIFSLAETAQREETQLTAAVAFLNQELGMPVQRQITAAVDDAAKVLRIEIIDEPANAAPGGAASAAASRTD